MSLASATLKYLYLKYLNQYTPLQDSNSRMIIHALKELSCCIMHKVSIHLHKKKKRKCTEKHTDTQEETDTPIIYPLSLLPHFSTF